MRFSLLADSGGLPPLRPISDVSPHIGRSARSAWRGACNILGAFAGGIARGFDCLMDRMERAQNAPRDAFFAEAVDLCDLEHRIQHYERTGLTRY